MPEIKYIHYLIDPGKPAQNGTVERSHREDQEKFYEQNIFKDFKDLKQKLKRWNMYYNDLEHCGLKGKSIGGFVISKNHANFIINTKEGKPDDLKKIIDLIKSEVRKKFNINLKEEVVILH